MKATALDFYDHKDLDCVCWVVSNFCLKQEKNTW